VGVSSPCGAGLDLQQGEGPILVAHDQVGVSRLAAEAHLSPTARVACREAERLQEGSRSSVARNATRSLIWFSRDSSRSMAWLASAGSPSGFCSTP